MIKMADIRFVRFFFYNYEKYVDAFVKLLSAGIHC